MWVSVFYEVGIERKKNEVLLQSVAEYDEHKVRKAEVIPIEPFKMEVSEGLYLYDIVGFQDTSNFAISKRVYELLRDSGITGWQGYDIDIKGNRRGYYGFQVTGKCGEIFMPPKPGFYTGYKFELETWDKSDFFSPNGTMLLFCTDKVQKLFKEHNILNIELTNIDSVQTYSLGSG